MDNSQFSLLLNRYLDGELSPDEKNELQRILLSDPEARQQFWHDAQLHGSLRLLGEQEAGARVARRDLEKPGTVKVVPFGRRLWIGAAAAAVIVLIAVGFNLRPSGDEEQNQVADGEGNSQVAPLVESGASRPKLSERLFVTHRPRFASERVATARDRVRKLRTNLQGQPTSRL